MIGLGKAAEVMGCGQAQLLMNRMCTVIGEEIGKELLERKNLTDDMSLDQIVKIVCEFFGSTPQNIAKSEKGVEVKFSQSKICPNLHIEKDCPPICPWLGIMRGIGRSSNRIFKTSGVLDPSTVCTVSLTEG
jgi:hypothetical protein